MITASLITEPDLKTVFDYADYARNVWQYQMSEIQFNIENAGLGVMLE